jgi:hypothetical protein
MRTETRPGEGPGRVRSRSAPFSAADRKGDQKSITWAAMELAVAVFADERER